MGVRWRLRADADAGVRVRLVAANESDRGETFWPELACLRGRVAITTLREAQLRAERVGVGADRALIVRGALDEESYVRALAAEHRVLFADLDATPRALCPLDDARLIQAATAGLILLQSDQGLTWVVAPRHRGARGLAELLAARPTLAGRFRLTTTARLDDFVLRAAGPALARRAADGLGAGEPQRAAERWPRRSGLAAAGGGLFALIVAPQATVLAVQAGAAAFFLSWLALRLATARVPRLVAAPIPDRFDVTLPVYTVIVALYREAGSVEALLRGLAQLDYPREKLDIILAIESDDDETRAAIAVSRGALATRIIVVPDGEPRTKPRALNVALPFARGAFTVIYDAEDRPEPDQLRRALQAFAEADDRLACVQARLCIDNTKDSWLTGLFTAEYAAQFEVFLNGMSAFGLPLPLGGSSNHFVTSVLRDVGGWDAWNVTEDADLGIRLARRGYRTTMIASTTYEEAPARMMPWLRQRTRWFKGWMQTWRLHMRQPLQLWRELGPRGFCAFQLVVGGNAFAALAHPVCMALLAADLLLELTRSAAGDLWPLPTNLTLLAGIYGICLLSGYAASVALGVIGLNRHGLPHAAWVLLLTPVHWMLLSLAAWRAVGQLLFAPHLWEKTDHGLARHSRRAERLRRSLRALERHLTSFIVADRPAATDAERDTPQRTA